MNVTCSIEMSIGHRLLGYEGKCAFLHGHNYLFEVTVTGKPDSLGLVVDFRDLKRFLKDVLSPFDHAMVLHHEDPACEILSSDKLVMLSVNPTAENLASFLFNKLIDNGFAPVSTVVRETSDGWATATTVDRQVRIMGVQ